MRKVKTTIGLTAKVKIFGKNKKNKVVTARIDTGATISSIDQKLAYSLQLGPVIRTKIVKSAHGNDSRPVIPAKILLAKKEIESAFTIADRSKLKYPMLIGQNILKTGFLIDPSKK